MRLVVVSALDAPVNEKISFVNRFSFQTFLFTMSSGEVRKRRSLSGIVFICLNDVSDAVCRCFVHPKC